MRFIYLSTKIEGNETKENAINSFKNYLREPDDKFHISEGKIDISKFDEGEDIFFLHPEKVFGYYTYKIVAYCRAGSGIKKTVDNSGSLFPYYFEINSDSLKIFVDGIDVKYIQNFVNDSNNDISKNVNIVGAVKNNGNGFNGSSSWVYFDKQDSIKIMKWFRAVILEENIQVLCNL
ncbi:hypothetical protein G9F71_000780 [Clostridium sp. FP2]|uniref:hypothetical protein n=1 Tax=Clostridium sp. FP2 TaxID=2724481 RepID=UPI0013E92504|nr:hypothetical protein [Clostridium sp. FP2]MBZ9621426.1 hypothetical protein [Clostridium sp. FP2]